MAGVCIREEGETFIVEFRADDGTVVETPCDSVVDAQREMNRQWWEHSGSPAIAGWPPPDEWE